MIFLQAERRHSKLFGVEALTWAYTLLTSLFIAVLWPRMDTAVQLLQGRMFVVAGLIGAYLLYIWMPCPATRFLRKLYPLTLLSYWYPDTYEFCRLFPYQDHLFAAADLACFGTQPSLAFSEWLSGKGWSELFHMGYFSYYPMIALTVLAPLFTCRERFDRTAFVVLAAFFLYYLIYLFLPVAGPQYYFCAIGESAARAGEFTPLGHYFASHTDMLPSPGPQGFFHDLIESTQAGGERPTAAFPSSHVGISTLLMLLLWQGNRALVPFVAPFYIVLCCSTVYIEAHYLVDVFGGLVSGVLFYVLCNKAYDRWAMREANPLRPDALGF